MPRHLRFASQLLLLWIALAGVVEAQFGDPFAPSLRWTHSAPLTEPWIPESAQFGMGGDVVWASGNFGSPRLMLLAAPGEILGDLIREDQGVAPSIAVLSATAKSETGRVFSIAQYPAPDSLNRRTEISRYDPLEGTVGAPLSPTWIREAGFTTNGPARVACDAYGRTVVAAVWNSATGFVQLDWISGQWGGLARRIQVPMSGISVLDVSNDGRRVVLSGGRDLYVFDSLTGTSLHHQPLASSTNAVAISGDGLTIAFGAFGEAHILREVGSVIQPLQLITGNVNHLPTRMALSEDGETLAIGWWNFVTSSEVRYEMLDVATGSLLTGQVQVRGPGGLQNFPQAVCITPDGSRAAFGGWGSGGPEAEVLLMRRDSSVPVLSVNLPGSVRSLDLDASGRRLIVGTKNTHANQFGTTGELRLYETGEDDLVQLSPASLGGDFEIAAKREGANSVVFMVGVKGSGPAPVAGFAGGLHLTRRLPLHLEIRSTDAGGRADASFPIPVNPAWTGHQLSVQAVFRMGAGVREFSNTCLSPLLF